MTGEWGLIASAALLGVAALPHCAAMCSVPCRGLGVAPGGPGGRAFLLGRLVGYAGLGAVVSVSVAQLSAWAGVSAALRPLWHLVQTAGALLGVYLLVTGRQPAWMAAWSPVALGRAAQRPGTNTGWAAASAGQGGSVWVPVSGPGRGAAPASGVGVGSIGTGRAVGIGLLWSLWPCSLLQSALVVAGLTSTAAGGAAAMAAFAVTSAPGLWLGARLLRGLSVGGDGARGGRSAVRLAGLLMLGATAWAVGHDWWPSVAAWCRAAW